MQILRDKIKADKKLLVAANMELSEAEAKGFWPVYEKYQDELFLLRGRTVKLIKDYSDAYEKMSNDKAKALLDELMKIDSLGLKLRQAYVPKFRQVLPEVKVVRYYQIENKINAALNYELATNIPLMKSGPVVIRKRGYDDENITFDKHFIGPCVRRVHPPESEPCSGSVCGRNQP